MDFLASFAGRLQVAKLTLKRNKKLSNRFKTVRVYETRIELLPKYNLNHTSKSNRALNLHDKLEGETHQS